MKTLSSRLTVTVVALLVSAFAALAGAPVASFAEKAFDFGNIQEKKGPVSHEFIFTNTGDEPLVIIDAKASCGCTRPKYPSEPVKPGKSAKIKVTYIPEGRPGEFVKTVKVRTNDKKNKKITLRISGTVIPEK